MKTNGSKRQVLIFYGSTLFLACAMSVYSHAQGIERCDPEIIAKERYKLPANYDAGGSAAGRALANQVLLSMGWTDFLKNTVMYFEGVLTTRNGERRTVTGAYKGRNHIHINEQVSDGTMTIIVDGLVAQVQHNGKSTIFSGDSLGAEYNWIPFFTDLRAGEKYIRFSNPISVQRAGGTQLDIRGYHVSANIHSLHAAGSTDTPYRRSGRLTESRFFINPTTSQLLEERICAPLVNNSLMSTLVIQTYSQYQSVNGVSYPSHIEQSLDKQSSRMIDISKVIIGASLPESYWSIKNQQ